MSMQQKEKTFGLHLQVSSPSRTHACVPGKVPFGYEVICRDKSVFRQGSRPVR
jgi:hypothetical protein